MSHTMPLQKPGQSRQDYETPDALIRAVELKFGPLTWDLAARADNAKAPHYITPEENSLNSEWLLLGGLKWLNPPFDRIAPWAEKCLTGGRILLLTPASVGSNWHRDFIHGRALVYFLNGRLTFKGETSPYPKDCMISLFGTGRTGYEVWDWRETLRLAKNVAA